jgi:hypothetical protein
VESTGEIQESPMAKPAKLHFTSPDCTACNNNNKKKKEKINK